MYPPATSATINATTFSVTSDPPEEIAEEIEDHE